MNFSKNGRFFDDMARFATGTADKLANVKGHFEEEVRACAMRFAREMDFVPRDEFEIVESMAKKAREENEALKKRIDKLEEKITGTKKNKDIKPAKHKDTKKKEPVRLKATKNKTKK